jgi:hypothetical protein
VSIALRAVQDVVECDVTEDELEGEEMLDRSTQVTLELVDHLHREFIILAAQDMP